MPALNSLFSKSLIQRFIHTPCFPLPLNLVSPVRCAHRAFGYVLPMPCLEALGSGRHGLVPCLALLTKTNCLYLVTALSHNNVTLDGMARGTLGFVKA